MKRILLAGLLALTASVPAFAADLPVPVKAPYMPIVPPFTWAGFYIGLNGGYGFGQSQWTSPLFTVGGFSTDGGLAGGTIGGNYQWQQFVIGLEGDIDWQNLRGAQTSAPCFLLGGCATASNWVSTVRIRAGFAPGRALFYLTGGAAFTTVKPSVGALPYGGGFEPGWTAGAGAEYALTDNWTAKFEYLFADFQHATCGIGSCLFAAPATVSFKENMVRVGVNYLFNY